MLPDYPASRELALDDQPVFNRLFAENPPDISEFTFTNLYGWRSAYQFRISRLGEWILLHSRKGLLPPVGNGDPKPVILQLLQGGEQAVIRIPEGLASRFQDTPRVTLHADPDNADYLYRAENLRQLKGRRYDGKRGLIKKFKNDYTYEYSRLTQSLCEECLAFEDFWCEIRACDQDENLAYEREAIRAMLANFDRFHLRGGAIRVDGRIVALALAEALNPDTLVMHVLKALPDMKGLYQIMFRDFLEQEAAGFLWVNAEQDLGVPGLRQAKESYHPDRKNMKFILRFKP